MSRSRKVAMRITGSRNRRLCYEQSDLESGSVVELLQNAEEMWNDACRDYVDEHGDKGATVSRAGIAVWFVEPRCRKPKIKIILNTGRLCCQGSSVYEDTVKPILKHLKSKGIDAFYDSAVLVELVRQDESRGCPCLILPDPFSR